MLNKCVRNGTSKSATVLRTGTGIGSSADDLSSRRDTAAATSSDDIGVIIREPKGLACPNLERRFPTLDRTRIPVSRTNGQRSGLETGGGIPCRPNPAATLLVIQSVLLDVMSNQVYIVPEYLPIKCLTRMTLGLVSILLPCV